MRLYDRELRIVEKRGASNTWSIKELYERGAFRETARFSASGWSDRR
jgi:hypothetical protein